MKSIKEVIINGKSLEEILISHKKWLKNEEGGEKVDLRGVDLSCVDLSNADLSDADLRGVDLRGVDLRGANLRGANLSCVDLSDADLRGANLSCVDLSCVDLNDADLRGVDLSCVDLSCVDLRGANLSYVDLSCVKYNENTSFLALQCPEEGSFIGFKKCKDNTIVKLLITEDALRSSATSRKCRCSKAKVLEITDREGNSINSVSSKHDEKFVYEVGKIVEVKDFDSDRWNECSTGIHFFITKREADLY